ncbi:MAG: NUDIX hydrolase [Bifidobacteriaceae bacterium]|jgi:8-oxo-dGTP pyrophosphatase MutT (NUDIX family)|nr:NUDIX hydrolase [Bifidobacteriaceae bacterium]
MTPPPEPVASPEPVVPPAADGDGFVDCACAGGRHWGLHGAAGLLLRDAARGAVLLQRRSESSHMGGTWGIPGGARGAAESALDAALREAGEEAGVPADAVAPRWWREVDHGPWSYTTVAADAARAIELGAGNWESAELAWVPVADVAGLELHPGFGAAWPALGSRLGARLTLVVDAANVMGSRPDGWWRDRAGAAARLRDRLAPLEVLGVPGWAIGWPEFTGFWPEIVLVVEGQAKSLPAPARSGPPAARPVKVVKAAGEGDSEIVAQAVQAVARGDIVAAVTADRELRDRLSRAGAATLTPGALNRLLP